MARYQNRPAPNPIPTTLDSVFNIYVCLCVAKNKEEKIKYLLSHQHLMWKFHFPTIFIQMLKRAPRCMALSKQTIENRIGKIVAFDLFNFWFYFWFATCDFLILLVAVVTVPVPDLLTHRIKKPHFISLSFQIQTFAPPGRSQQTNGTAHFLFDIFFVVVRITTSECSREQWFEKGVNEIINQNANIEKNKRIFVRLFSRSACAIALLFDVGCPLCQQQTHTFFVVCYVSHSRKGNHLKHVHFQYLDIRFWIELLAFESTFQRISTLTEFGEANVHQKPLSTVNPPLNPHTRWLQYTQCCCRGRAVWDRSLHNRKHTQFSIYEERERGNSIRAVRHFRSSTAWFASAGPASQISFKPFFSLQFFLSMFYMPLSPCFRRSKNKRKNLTQNG